MLARKDRQLAKAKQCKDSGDASLDKGDYESAVASLSKAIAVYERLEPEDSTMLGDCYHLLGRAQCCQESYGVAVATLTKAVRCRSVTHPGSIALAQSYQDLGKAYRNKKDLVNAIANYDHAKIIYEREAPKSVDMGDVYNNLGRLYYSLEEYSTAVDYLRKAVKSRQRTGSNYLGSTLACLGHAYYGKGEYRRSIKAQEQAMKLLGVGSEELAWAKWGKTYSLISMYGTADARAQRLVSEAQAIASSERYKGTIVHVSVLLAQARLDEEADDYEQAAFNARQTLSLNACRRDRFLEAQCRLSLGRMLCGVDQLEQSFEELEKAKAYLAIEKPNSRRLAETLNCLGQVELKRENVEKAELFFDRAERILVSRRLESTINFVENIYGRAQVAYQKRDKTGAEELLVSAIQVCDEKSIRSKIYGLASEFLEMIRIGEDTPTETSSRETQEPSPSVAAEDPNVARIRAELAAGLQGSGHLPLELCEEYIDHFDTRMKLGSGFFGEVFLARDKNLNRDFALKIINSELLRTGHDKNLHHARRTFVTEIEVSKDASQRWCVPC